MGGLIGSAATAAQTAAAAVTPTAAQATQAAQAAATAAQTAAAAAATPTAAQAAQAAQAAATAAQTATAAQAAQATQAAATQAAQVAQAAQATQAAATQAGQVAQAAQATSTGVTGTRRLRQQKKNADNHAHAGAKRRLEGQKVVMTFKHGVHYKIDKPLIEMMLRHKMFDIQDDISMKDRRHPPLFIKDFEIHAGKEQPNPLYKGESFGAGLVSPAHSTLGLVTLAGLLVLAAVVSIFVFARSQAYRKVPVESESAARTDSEVPRLHLALE